MSPRSGARASANEKGEETQAPVRSARAANADGIDAHASLARRPTTDDRSTTDEQSIDAPLAGREPRDAVRVLAAGGEDEQPAARGRDLSREDTWRVRTSGVFTTTPA